MHFCWHYSLVVHLNLVKSVQHICIYYSFHLSYLSTCTRDQHNHTVKLCLDPNFTKVTLLIPVDSDTQRLPGYLSVLKLFFVQFPIGNQHIFSSWIYIAIYVRFAAKQLITGFKIRYKLFLARNNTSCLNTDFVFTFSRR